MKFTKICLLLLATVVFATACSSDADSAVAVASNQTTTAPDTIGAEPASLASADTEGEATEQVAPTTTIEPEPTTPATEAPVDPTDNDCVNAPSGFHHVDVPVDDPDGGLNVRLAPGVDAEVVAVVPPGELVGAGGPCEVIGGTEWWGIEASGVGLEGWVSSNYLQPQVVQTCPAGTPDFDDVDQVRLEVGDFDGDGGLDQLMIGNIGDDDPSGSVKIAMQLASGGLAEAELDGWQAAEIYTIFEPVGTNHDVIMVRDQWGGGASTNLWALVDLIDCTPTRIGEILQGGSAGWGGQGDCFETTKWGLQLGTWTTIGDDEAERIANRTAERWLYSDGSFVVVDDSLDDRVCVEPPRTGLGFNDMSGEPGLIGLSAPTPDDLILAVADHFAPEEDEGPDVWPGNIRFLDSGDLQVDVIGIADDSVGGFQLHLIIDTNDEGLTLRDAIKTPICSRGVNTDGLCV